MKLVTRFYLYFSLIIAVFLLHAVYLNCVVEDAFITFRYARNLTDGHGFVWNVGEAPVEGYTNFLWVVVCALALNLGLDLLLFAQAAGVLAGLVSLIYTYKFTRLILNDRAVLSLIPCLFLAISGPFTAWAGSGMEISFFGALMLAACYHLASYWQSGSYRDVFLCYALLLVATLTRPEGFIVFCILSALNVTLSAIGLGRSRKCLFFAGALCITLVSVYFGWRMTYYGLLLPNTYYAKTSGTIYQYIRGAAYVSFFGLFFIVPLLPVLILLWWEKCIPKVFTGSSLWAIRDHLRHHVGVCLSILVSITYTLYIVWVGGDYMAMYRFFVPILPFIYILFGVTAVSLCDLISGSSKKKVIVTGLLILAAVATAVQSTPLEELLFEKPPLQHGAFRGVLTERWHVARLSLIGTFFGNYKRSDEESVASYAIGALAYYANMRVYDFFGIVDTEIARKELKGRNAAFGFAGHQKTDWAHILSKKPTYVVFNRNLTEKSLEYPELSGSLAEFIRVHYRVRSVWLADDINDQEGFFTFLEIKRDEPDSTSGPARHR